MDKHTPTPWKTEPLNPYILGGPHELGICLMLDRETDSATVKANAAFIVRAVNSHYQLLSACKTALAVIDKLSGADRAGIYLHDAIAKAEGT